MRRPAGRWCAKNCVSQNHEQFRVRKLAEQGGLLAGTACLSSSLLIHVTERAVTSDGRYVFPEQPGQGTYMEGPLDPSKFPASFLLPVNSPMSCSWKVGPTPSAPLQTPGVPVVCLSWIFSQTPDLSVSGSLWPFMSPEPLCISFSFQKAG